MGRRAFKRRAWTKQQPCYRPSLGFGPVSATPTDPCSVPGVNRPLGNFGCCDRARIGAHQHPCNTRAACAPRRPSRRKSPPRRKLRGTGRFLGSSPERPFSSLSVVTRKCCQGRPVSKARPGCGTVTDEGRRLLRCRFPPRRPRVYADRCAHVPAALDLTTLTAFLTSYWRYSCVSRISPITLLTAAQHSTASDRRTMSHAFSCSEKRDRTIGAGVVYGTEILPRQRPAHGG